VGYQGLVCASAVGRKQQAVDFPEPLSWLTLSSTILENGSDTGTS
jgi:hypothetical protein